MKNFVKEIDIKGVGSRTKAIALYTASAATIGTAVVLAPVFWWATGKNKLLHVGINMGKKANKELDKCIK